MKRGGITVRFSYNLGIMNDVRSTKYNSLEQNKEHWPRTMTA